MAENEEELKSLLMKVKEESEKAGLKLSIKKWRSRHLVPPLHGKQMGKQWKQWEKLFSWAPKSLQTVIATMKLKDACSLEWRRQWYPTPVLLPGNPMDGGVGRLQSMGSLRVGHDWTISLLLFTFMHWRRKWQCTPMFFPGEFQGQESMVGWCLWGHTESGTTEVT